MARSGAHFTIKADDLVQSKSSNFAIQLLAKTGFIFVPKTGADYQSDFVGRTKQHQVIGDSALLESKSTFSNGLTPDEIKSAYSQSLTSFITDVMDTSLLSASTARSKSLKHSAILTLPADAQAGVSLQIDEEIIGVSVEDEQTPSPKSTPGDLSPFSRAAGLAKNLKDKFSIPADAKVNFDLVKLSKEDLLKIKSTLEADIGSIAVDEDRASQQSILDAVNALIEQNKEHYYLFKLRDVTTPNKLVHDFIKGISVPAGTDLIAYIEKEHAKDIIPAKQSGYKKIGRVVPQEYKTKTGLLIQPDNENRNTDIASIIRAIDENKPLLFGSAFDHALLDGRKISDLLKEIKRASADDAKTLLRQFRASIKQAIIDNDKGELQIRDHLNQYFSVQKDGEIVNLLDLAAARFGEIGAETVVASLIVKAGLIIANRVLELEDNEFGEMVRDVILASSNKMAEERLDARYGKTPQSAATGLGLLPAEEKASFSKHEEFDLTPDQLSVSNAVIKQANESGFRFTRYNQKISVESIQNDVARDYSFRGKDHLKQAVAEVKTVEDAINLFEKEFPGNGKLIVEHFGQGPASLAGTALNTATRTNKVMIKTGRGGETDSYAQSTEMYQQGSDVYQVSKFKNFLLRDTSGEHVFGYIEGPVELLYKLTGKGFELVGMKASEIIQDIMRGTRVPDDDLSWYASYRDQVKWITHPEYNKCFLALNELFEKVQNNSNLRVIYDDYFDALTDLNKLGAYEQMQHLTASVKHTISQVGRGNESDLSIKRDAAKDCCGIALNALKSEADKSVAFIKAEASTAHADGVADYKKLENAANVTEVNQLRALSKGALKAARVAKDSLDDDAKSELKNLMIAEQKQLPGAKKGLKFWVGGAVAVLAVAAVFTMFTAAAVGSAILTGGATLPLVGYIAYATMAYVAASVTTVVAAKASYNSRRQGFANSLHMFAKTADKKDQAWHKASLRSLPVEADEETASLLPKKRN